MNSVSHESLAHFLPQHGGGGARQRTGGGSVSRATFPSVSLRFAPLATSPMLGEERCAVA